MKLQEKYRKQVIPAMKEKFGYRNDLAVPKIVKVVINVGTGKFRDNERAIEDIQRSLASVAGQQPVFTLAKQSIANFKTRKGMKVGMKVTLRGKMMYDFLGRLINFALPRSRDFRGLDEKIVDQNGNLSIGIKEHIIFPEISHEEVKTIFGFEVCVATNARNRGEGLELFRLIGFPIKR